MLRRSRACLPLIGRVHSRGKASLCGCKGRMNRHLHITPSRFTDGVYHELTSMRINTPWIEALRMQKEKSTGPSKRSSASTVPQDRDLTPKRMSDSFHRIILPLAQDPWLLDNYLNASGHLRLGTIFMDLDALSGIIAYKHTGDSVTTVTAAVDRITINHPLEEICDLELSGQVTYATGRSSMEISIQVAKASKEGVEVNNKDVLLTCAFTMVSLDPVTKKPVAIPGLRTETPEERKLFEKGEKNSQEKKALSKSSLLKQTPNDEESDLIHAMWLKHLDYLDNTVSVRKPDEVIYMDQTKIHSTQIMQPQYRNRHNFMIFGGFLLKQTFELAFCCAASCSHSRPTFLSLDPSTFENPVPVGSVLYLTATVAYTDPPVVTGREERANSGNQNEDSPEDSDAEAAPSSSEFTRIQVRVDSRVRNVEHGKAKPTGQFNYTFLVEKDIKVMPRTYSEFMIYTIARRRAQRVSASLGDDGGWNGLQYQGKDRVTE